jgi:hypothetical protein
MRLKALDVQLTEDAVVTWHEQRHTHIVQAIHVKAVIVKLLLGPLAKKVLCPGLPPGVVALTPSIVGVTPTILGKEYRAGVVQVAMVSSRCLTGHKMQGMTVPSVRLINFLKHQTTSRQWLYVACSRVPTLQGLFSEQPLKTLPRYWNKADLALDHEMARLYLMELETDVRIIEARHEMVPQDLRKAIVTQSAVLAEVLNRLHYLKTRAWLTGPPTLAVQPTERPQHKPWSSSNRATGVHSHVRPEPQRLDKKTKQTRGARSPRKRQRTSSDMAVQSPVLASTDKQADVSQEPIHEMEHEEIPSMDELHDTQVSTISICTEYPNNSDTIVSKHCSHIYYASYVTPVIIYTTPAVRRS